MDTIRLKFLWRKTENFYFQQLVRNKEYQFSFTTEKRSVWTNHTWRKQQQGLGIYMPKYFIEPDVKYPEQYYFCFEASLPKFMGGENVTSLENITLEEVAKKISAFCIKMDVFIFPHQIEAAIPTLLAIGKNLNLTELCSCGDAIKVVKPFDYKEDSKYRLIDFSDQKHGGKEIIFSHGNETFKVYDKSKEILNNAKTQKEIEITKLIQEGKYMLDNKPASEILRIELTIKNRRSIRRRFKPYLEGKTPTLKNLFDNQLWERILKDEALKTFNHPLKKILFLSLESQPVIDSFLDRFCPHIQTKDTIRAILKSMQEIGLAGTRKKYLRCYKSRQTWYNYLERLIVLQKHVNWSALDQLDNVKIYKFILKQFGINTESQEKMEFNSPTQMSK